VNIRFAKYLIWLSEQARRLAAENKRFERLLNLRAKSRNAFVACRVARQRRQRLITNRIINNRLDSIRPAQA
jgi:hypothetical protein